MSISVLRSQVNSQPTTPKEKFVSVTQALENRRSVRAFSAVPLDDTLVNEILQTALAAPSWGNVQPYRIGMASGERCNEVRTALATKYRQASAVKKGSLMKKLAALLKGGVLPDGDYKTLLKYPGELNERYFATGKGLYEVLGISRDDRKGRESQMARNFSFFDAPTVLFVFCEDSLGPYGPLDTGIFVQSLVLAAQERGVDTCVQGSVATWASPLSKHFDTPAGYKLICGIAMGYGKQAPVNGYKPARRELAELLLPLKSMND
ncbi:MAG: nitroreductase [Halioglobus sp.]